MTGAIVQNIKNFYDTTVFFVILAIGVFLLFWDYPIFKSLMYKNDSRITAIMGILCLIIPFVLLYVSRM